MKKEKFYMNPMTGSVDNYEGWNYIDENNCSQNAVDNNEVIEVQKDSDGNWEEVE